MNKHLLLLAEHFYYRLSI